MKELTTNPNFLEILIDTFLTPQAEKVDLRHASPVLCGQVSTVHSYGSSAKPFWLILVPTTYTIIGRASDVLCHTAGPAVSSPRPVQLGMSRHMSRILAVTDMPALFTTADNYRTLTGIKPAEIIAGAPACLGMSYRRPQLNAGTAHWAIDHYQKHPPAYSVLTPSCLRYPNLSTLIAKNRRECREMVLQALQEQKAIQGLPRAL
ncbi:hypothetical protein CROQUDRAFT_103577 [Cronartium quercuum f. sp. fusiforme G11]|uniref:Uncharacterized protein n=1 Tax=Cronartium quercuum f. sp. fusiforme G11 TaxID=708437 RepID=A0A9P6NY21_9BASI|nr:hypothetical protein CROQUDRAFT_103577 [Cronartium quercuum f. sp. fusiforme G11]